MKIIQNHNVKLNFKRFVEQEGSLFTICYYLVTVVLSGCRSSGYAVDTCQS